MKFDIEIKAVINEKDPAYKTITEIGIEKAVENFKKDLSSNGVESIEVSIVKREEK